MRISRTLLALLLLSITGFVAAARADSLYTDTIDFPTAFGPIPTSSTFTYDLTTQTFTAFSVIWDGLSFDLTSAANSFGSPPCVGGLTGGAAAFALLSGDCSASPNSGWVGSNIFGQDSYEGPYFLFATTGYYLDDTLSSSIPNDGHMAQGSFAIDQSGGITGFQGGSSSSPVLLPSGVPVAEIAGTIGGLGSEDYYTFSWAGGAFSATASITGAPDDSASYSFSVASSCNAGGADNLNSSDGFTATFQADLAPGQYCIGINSDNANDPAFELTFTTPVDVATPEPSGFVLFSAGLGMIGILRFAARCRCRLLPARIRNQ